MIIILNISAEKFSLNGIPYFKNFMPLVVGGKLKVINIYDTRLELTALDSYSNYSVDGVVYTSLIELQNALLPVLYTRNSLNFNSDLPFYNMIIKQTGISSLGLSKTFNSGWEWLINNVKYSNIPPITINFPLALSGQQRLDRIVATNLNTFVRIPGVESSSSPAADPRPDNTVDVTFVLVTDTQVHDPTPPVLGDTYVQKFESQDLIFNSATAVIEQINLIDLRSSLSVEGSITDVKSIQVSNDYLRAGKPHFFKNRTGQDVKIWHNAGTGNIKYFFPNSVDLIVKPNEIIEFNLNMDYVGEYKFEYVGGIQQGTYIDEVYDGYLLSNVFYSDAGHTIVIPAETSKIYVDITAGQKNKQYRYSGSTYIQITNGLIASTDDVPEGATNKYSTLALVMSYILTGVSFASGAAITAGDTILSAFGKLQKQINDLLIAIGLKQDTLVSGTNIKTLNNASLLGPGNIDTFNRSFAILDDNFEDGTNSDLTLSAGWTLGIDGIAISSSGGWGNSALYNKYTTIDRVSTRALIQVITTTSIFSLIRKPTGLSQFGTVAQVDLNAMRLNLYASWDGSTTVPSVAKFVAIPFAIVANRKYLVELTKNKAVSVFTFTDETNPSNTISLTYDQETETISGIGRQWANPGVMFNSGSIKLKRFTYSTKFPNAPKLLITGHSFVEGYALYAEGDVSKTYSNLMYDSLIGNVAIAGRGGETIGTINTRNDVDFFSPTYHLVDIGSNDTVYATWLAGIQTYIAKIIAVGSIPVLATIVPRSGVQTFINQCNDWIRLSGYNYVDFAKAVTVNNDGITQDASLFWSDSVHPNIAGNAKMFQQIKIDAPYLWDGYEKKSLANLDVIEIIKTASFTISLADSGKRYVINSASAVVVTFPTGMTDGKWWEILTINTGAVSFVAGSSASLSSPDSRLKLRTQFSQAKIDARSGNQGILGGDIVL